jgi:hypothetical protein
MRDRAARGAGRRPAAAEIEADMDLEGEISPKTVSLRGFASVAGVRVAGVRVGFAC